MLAHPNADQEAGADARAAGVVLTPKCGAGTCARGVVEMVSALDATRPARYGPRRLRLIAASA